MTQICTKYREHNEPAKRTCVRCGVFLEGWTVNNMTGEYGYRNGDGMFTTIKEMAKLSVSSDSDVR